MPHYTVTAELTERATATTAERADQLVDALSPWHAAVGPSPYGYTEIRATIPADNLLQATATAAAILAHAQLELVHLDTVEVKLGEQRDADVQIPDLVDPPEAAEIIGVSRPTVLAMIERGELVHTRIGQRGTAIARASAEQARDARAA